MVEFFDRWHEVERGAADIRAASSSSPPQAPTDPLGSDAPIDDGGVVTYENSASPWASEPEPKPISSSASADHMTASGHDVVGRHYHVQAEARQLRADLLIRDLNVLVEAEATVGRNDIRLRIGQLLDYRRFEPGRPDLAVPLTDRPQEDMLDLLRELSIGCVWPEKGGYRDTLVDPLSH